MCGLVLIYAYRIKKYNRQESKTERIGLHLATINKEVHQAAVTVVSKQFRIICIQIIRAQHFKNTGAGGFLGQG